MRKQVHEILPDNQYAVAWYEGDNYSGPGGGFLFWDGKVPVPVIGALCKQNSLPLVAVFFEHIEGYELRWDGCEWQHEKPAPPKRPEKPAKRRKPKAEPANTTPEKKRAKRKPGRPKGSKNKKASK